MPLRKLAGQLANAFGLSNVEGGQHLYLVEACADLRCAPGPLFRAAQCSTTTVAALRAA